jgi:hypothetical protein
MGIGPWANAHGYALPPLRGFALPGNLAGYLLRTRAVLVYALEESTAFAGLGFSKTILNA